MIIIPFRKKDPEEEDNFSTIYEFLIKGTNKDPYKIEIEVDEFNETGLKETRCTCPHNKFRKLECKHIKLALKILEEFGING